MAFLFVPLALVIIGMSIIWILTSWKVILAIYAISTLVHALTNVSWAVHHRELTEKYYSWIWYFQECFIPCFNTLIALNAIYYYLSSLAKGN